MKLGYYIFLFASMFAFSNSLAAPENLNSVIKKKLQAELVELKQDISTASNITAKLHEDKAVIGDNLKAMEAWGIAQQNEKLAYYNETSDTRKQLADSAAKIEEIKKKQIVIIEKYHKIKSVMCYLAGVLMVLLYFSLGASLVSSLSMLPTAWTLILPIAGPVGSFGIGYLAVYLLF